MTHDEHLTHQQISLFLDAECSAEEYTAAQQHLDACHACALRIVAGVQLKAATTRAAKRFAAPPPDAINRLAAQLRSHAAPSAPAVPPTQVPPPVKAARVLRFPSWSWAALAASLLLTLTLFAWRVRQPNELSAELLDQHLAVMSAGAAPQVISSDRHTVKPWFQGKLPFSFNLPDSYPSDVVLRGGDLAYLHGQPAALLLFTVGKHQASVFLTQKTSAVPSAAHQTRSGFTVQQADAGELHIAAVSDVNPADLARLVDMLASAQTPPGR